MYKKTEMPQRSVLITGGAGFIGSRVVARLRTLGVQTIVFDNEYVGLPLPDALAGVIPVRGDIRETSTLSAVIREHRPDAILHLAAVHHIPTCERNPYLAFDVNVMGTQAVLDIAAENGVQDIVFASSGAVYEWKDGPLKEFLTNTDAKDVYSTTKLTGEYQLAAWSARTGSRAHIGRLFNTIGTGDPNGHLIPELLSQLFDPVSGTATVQLGDTRPKRDYVHVDDVSDAFIALLRGIKDGPAVNVFNICSGRDVTVADLVGMMGELLSINVIVESDPTRYRKIDRLQQLGDPTKMIKERGWSVQIPLRDALSRIIAEFGTSGIKSSHRAA